MADSPRIEELKRRVQRDPASIAFATLAEEYRRAGRFEDAIAACRAGLQRHPSYISAHVTLGRALLEVGAFEEAREELELVLRVAPENLAAIRGLAEIHRRGEATETDDFSEPDVAETRSGGPEMAPAATLVQSAATMPPLPEALAAAYNDAERAVPERVRPQPAMCVAAHMPQPSEDRALAGLEEFLEAIIRVRKAAGSMHVF